MLKVQLSLPKSSRHQRTKLYTQRGKAFFGVWRPIDIPLDGTEQLVTVDAGEEGQLNLFAHKYYGDKDLWWVIAQANGIDFPIEQVKQGSVLKIPRLSAVNAAIERATGVRED